MITNAGYNNPNVKNLVYIAAFAPKEGQTIADFVDPSKFPQGVLINDEGDNAFDGKPVAIISASVGMLGGARAQYHLRQTFVFLNMYPVNGPEVMLPFAQDKFDENGKLTEENTKKILRQLLQNLADWTRKLKNK